MGTESENSVTRQETEFSDSVPEPGAARHRAVRRVLLVTLALNLVVAVAKGAYGIWSGSLAIAADAVHSLVDASANIVGMIALRFAAAPPDPGHPYGHQKIEMAAAAAIGMAIGVTAIELGWSTVQALLDGRAAPATSAVGFAIIGGTWLINMFVATYERRRARQLDSAYLAADAAHTASDVAVTAAVLAAYTAAHFGVHWADPAGALLVLIVIVRVAWHVLSSNLSILVDRAVLDPDEVRAAARAVTGVSDCHRIRSRGTSQAVHVDLHVQIEGTMSLSEAHDVAHRVEEHLRHTWPGIVDVTIHIEPEDDHYEGL